MSLSISSYVVLSFLSSSACCDLSSRLCRVCSSMDIRLHPWTVYVSPPALWPVNYNLCVNLEIMEGMMGEWENENEEGGGVDLRGQRACGCFATISLISFLLIFFFSLTTTCQLQTSSAGYKEQVWVVVGGVVGVKCVFYWASSGVFHIHLH